MIFAYSPWFDGALQQPWEPGVYQRQIGRSTMYARWDGRVWSAARASIGQAVGVKWNIVSYTQVAMWRGLQRGAGTCRLTPASVPLP